MTKFKYLPQLAEALRTAKPELRIYEDYRNGKIQYPCVKLNVNSEEIQDWSDEHSTIELEVILCVPKEDENPDLANEINDLICSDVINDSFTGFNIHFIQLGDSEMEREDHTTEYSTNLTVAIYCSTNS